MEDIIVKLSKKSYLDGINEFKKEGWTFFVGLSATDEEKFISSLKIAGFKEDIYERYELENSQIFGGWNCIIFYKNGLMKKAVDEILRITAPAREKEGDKEEGIKMVPPKPLVDFSEYDHFFENTHSHLPFFETLKQDMGLKGDAYYVITKELLYAIESLKQNTIAFKVGTTAADNRIHLLEFIRSGRGKGVQRSELEKYNRGDYDSVVHVPFTRLNMEQLIGRITTEGKGKNKRIVEVRGYLNYKCCVIDECADLLLESEKSDSGLMVELRNATEVYGNNLVNKKLTAENIMRYYPEMRLVLFSHPIKLMPRFFDRGLARRVFATQIANEPISINAAWESLFEESKGDQIKEYLNKNIKVEGFAFDDEAKQELKEWIVVWAHFTVRHANQKVRLLGQWHLTSFKVQMLRLIAILAGIKGESIITRKTIAQASLDFVHFMLKTYEVFANEGTVGLSRDIWRTEDQAAAMFFERLWYNGATSEENTKISIDEAQTILADLAGLNDRQARAYFAKLVEGGLIGRKQGFQSSKAWLAFIPQIEGICDLDENVEELKVFLERKINQYELHNTNKINNNIDGGHGGNGGNVQSHIDILYTRNHNTNKINNNIYNINNITNEITNNTKYQEGTQNATITTMTQFQQPSTPIPSCSKCHATNKTLVHDPTGSGELICVDCLNGYQSRNDEE